MVSISVVGSGWKEASPVSARSRDRMPEGPAQPERLADIIRGALTKFPAPGGFPPPVPRRPLRQGWLPTDEKRAGTGASSDFHWSWNRSWVHGVTQSVNTPGSAFVSPGDALASEVEEAAAVLQ